MKIVKALDTAPPVGRDDEQTSEQPSGDLAVVALYPPPARHLSIGRAIKAVFLRSQRIAPIAESVRYFREGRILSIYLKDRELPVTIHVDNVAELTDLQDDILATIGVAFAGTVLTIEEQDIDISVEGLLRSAGGSDGFGPGGSYVLGKGSFRSR
ncbi:hypothetical protein [Burkholderia gladioli]|uniref:hypothetical protein n=1 Tax=Burkholderia gladioli TaxID=28095 RepID=UPI001640DC6D|nr:hypothetical protein [Burkholderia gladioli]